MTFGVLGCVLLLARKRIAKALFVVSLAGILVQNAYGFILGNGLDVFGASALVLPVLVIIVAMALVIFSARATDKGWLK